MRDLKQSEQNKLTLDDPISGSSLEICYRMPTTTERVRYEAALYRRKGAKVVVTGFSTRVRFGREIITGFRDGDFGHDGKPISADPKSPNFRADWKDLLAATAADVLAALAQTVFEGARTAREVSVEMEGAVEEEDAPPLQ